MKIALDAVGHFRNSAKIKIFGINSKFIETFL
jgi:hypothetical protein